MRLAVPMILMLVLAGCVAEEAPEAPADANASSDALADAPAPMDDGTTMMPGDVGHMPHMHDYWLGKERVTLFDGEIDMSANEDVFGNLEPVLVDKQPKLGRMLWQLPDGAIVFEGTGQMDLSADWTDPRITTLAAEYTPAPGVDMTEPFPLPNGELVSIPITPAMTDMPHMKTSRWVFGFETADQAGAALGPFHLKIEIVKLRDITAFPGHPELFHGLHEKILLDADEEHNEVSYAKRAPQLATEGDFSEKTIRPAQLVPMETVAMRIEVDILAADAAPGQVADIRFFYHGADSTFMGHPTILPVEGSMSEKRFVYQFEVNMTQTDTPYGAESQWEFFVEPATKFTGQAGEPDCGGCTDVHIKYHLKAIAYDHPLETYSELEGGQ